MSILEKVERIIKIISAIAIPIVIGVFGYIIDITISNQTLAKEYVVIGLDILYQENEVAPEMKDWALKLINKNAPVKISDSVLEKIKDGLISFPSLSRANESFKAKEYSKSIGELTLLIKNNPNDFELYNKRGYSYYQIGKLEKALDDYSTALEKAPDAYGVYSNIATVYFKQRNFKKSIEALSKAISMFPENGEYYYKRGLSYLRLKDNDNSCTDFNKAYRLGYMQAQTQINRYCKE